MMILLRKFWDACTAQNVFTFVIAAATVGVYLVAKNQWKVMDRQTTNSEQVQRAFVYSNGFAAMPAEVDSKTGVPKIFNMYVQWRNSGTTPTSRGFSWVNHVVSETEMSKDFGYPNYNDDGAVIDHACKPMFFAPTTAGEGTLSVPFKLDSNTMLKVHTHKTHLYVYGWAKYQTVFDRRSGRSHISRFCYELADAYPVGHPPTETISMNFVPCPDERNSCIDDQCQKPDEAECTWPQ